MNIIETMRKGWCPGALAPMLSGDGYIFRLRLTNGALSFAHARVFADLARRYGNGAFDLSARANLQMRGVGAEGVAPLQAELRAFGLLDDDPRAEAVRNIIPSPLAGHDDSALLDARPLVVALEHMLIRERALHDLPPKFGFSVDGRGLLPLRGVETDIGFAAFHDEDEDCLRLRVALGGVVVGSITPDHFLATAEHLARNFLRLRKTERRMSALLARLDATVGLIGLFENVPLDIEAPQRSATPLAPGAYLGARGCGASACFVGAGLLFGRVEADALQRLAEAAEACGAAELRLTPWRALLAVGLDEAGARRLADRAETLGFLLDAADPRLAFNACPGAPACGSAHGDVRAVALALSRLWNAGAGPVHVSGCAKGCAMNRRALTLVARGDGFAWIENGLARDEPAEILPDLAALQSRFSRHVSGATV